MNRGAGFRRVAAILSACLVGVGSVPPGHYVAVTPDGTGVTQLTNSGPFAAAFVVTNTGSYTDSYYIVCFGRVNITCDETDIAYLTLDPGQYGDVVATYFTGATPGVGRVVVLATGDGNPAADSGYYNVTVQAAPPTVTLAAPVLTSGTRALVRTRQPLIRATFLPNGSAIDTTQTSLKWRGETVTSLARHNRGLIEWEVDSTRWLAIGDSAQIEVRSCSQNALCTTVTRWAVLLADNKPVLGFQGMPLEALGRQFGSPFGPGLAVAGADVESGLAIPGYVSLNAVRSAGLVYSTRQSYPRSLVPVDLELTWPTGTPDQVKLILLDGAVKLDSLVLASPTCATGPARRCRAVLQADFAGSTFSTPTRKWVTVEARVTSGSTTHIGADSVEVVLVDRRSTPYGSGWWPAGFLKLVAAGSDRLLVAPNGTAAVFRGNGDSLYVSPPGDVSVLVRTATGWELTPRGSTAKLVFDSYGRLRAAVDQNANRDSVAYSGSSDQVTAFRDPLGKAITFAYDGNGKLQTITDPGGRQNRITVTSSQLTYDSISSSTSRPYTTRYAYQAYPGTNTVVLTRRIGVIADTTVVTYDSTFRRRPVQVSLPVVDTGGGTTKPVISYVAYERRGYGALVSLDSVYAEVKDPRNNWTRALLNRWGQARKAWDALGTLGRSEYSPEGLVLWSEGKAADSSRAYRSYDALRRLVRTYIVRTAADTLRMDSLVYDASHRVVQRIDARGKRDSTVYDTNGNVTRTITPHNDTTKFWYRTDGLLDSLRAPGTTASRRFSYDATWRNVYQVTVPGGTIVATTRYDYLGRDSVTDRKVRVRVTGTTSKWQWRRTQPFYTLANQVDSIRLLRTDTCDDPCANPSWPPPSDTLRTQRVGMRFDRAGRDSVRLNDRGTATLYRYDRLGRLVSRRPWTDSMAVRDSVVYDVAGNVKKAITRRGDTLTTTYDSRNRATLSVIPGVGTLQRTFGGPLDQLTRLWLASPVDSIGTVNAELRWAYDQRGRLKADTSYTGNAARATTYTYDAYERLSTRTDALGAWTTRYETDRGVADTLLTPLGDTVTYAFDARDRPVGPSLRGGGPLHQRGATWNNAGALITLTATVSTSPTWWPLVFERDETTIEDPAYALAPQWREQHGSGAAIDTLQDSLLFDGWERLAAQVIVRNAHFVLARDTFRFDRIGNVLTTAGVETYHAITGRLLSRSSAGGTRHYGYDRAGNLVKDSLAGGAETWVYGYDALNRLRSARRNGTLIARYGYDVVGRRIAKRVYSAASGGTVAYTRFVYHGAHVSFETDSVGTIALRYTWGLAVDDLIAVRTGTGSGGEHFYVTQDLLRSVRGLVKRDGTWVLSQLFGPYGSVVRRDTSATGPGFALRYGWTGREYDAETGFYFFRSRYYSVPARRFVQEDAIGYAGGLNLYAYGDGNPLTGRDPDGLMKNFEAYAYDPNDWARLNAPDGPSTWDEWQFVANGHGGGEWMPPGLSSAMQEAFVGGVVGMGRVLASAPTIHEITIAFAGGGAATVSTTSAAGAASVIAANLGAETPAAVLVQVSAPGDQPTWQGLVPSWTSESPYPDRLRLVGGGARGHSGTWGLGFAGETTRITFGRGYPRYDSPTPAGRYTGYFVGWGYTSPIRAVGYVWPSTGWGVFVAYPDQPWRGCMCL